MLGFAPLCTLPLCSLPDGSGPPPVLTPDLLAQLYGGRLFLGEEKRKKKKKKTVEEMVQVLAAAPEWKEAAVRALPKAAQRELPSADYVLNQQLIDAFEVAATNVKSKLRKLYDRRVEEEADDDEDEVIFLLM